MPLDIQSKIDIPESIEGYKVTLFWNLTIKQVVLVFIATLFVGFGVFSLVSHKPLVAMGMTIMAVLSLLAMAEVRGRNFYRHIWFIISYYKNKPQVLIYHHYSLSGTAATQAKQLVYQKQDNSKIFIIIFIALALGLALLGLAGVYIYHVIHH
jgi:hypothetical protein